VAPLERGGERLLPRRSGPSSPPQQFQSVAEPSGGTLNAEGRNPASRQLDRQRNPVETTADLRHCRSASIYQTESIIDLRDTRDEKLDGGKRERFGCRGHMLCRHSKRRQSKNMLTFDLEGF
jgi:hypothetical protein